MNVGQIMQAPVNARDPDQGVHHQIGKLVRRRSPDRAICLRRRDRPRAHVLDCKEVKGWGAVIDHRPDRPPT